MKQIKTLLNLFWDFFKIGLFTFGGGWSIVAQMQKLYVESRQVIKNEDLIDLTSVGRSLPGIMIINVSMLFGYRMAGYAGGLACIFGISLPPLLILSVITFFYTAFSQSIWVAAAMTGVRAAVVPIIAYAAMTMVKSSIRNIPCVLVALLAFAAYHFVGLSCIWIILIGAICGFILSAYTVRKNGQKL